MNAAPALPGLLDSLLRLSVNITANTAELDSPSISRYRSLSRSIKFTMMLFKRIIKSDIEKWIKLDDLISDQLRNAREVKTTRESPFTPEEIRVQRIAAIASAESSAEVTANELLFDNFQADTVLRFPAITGKLIVNIELDGIHHNQDKKKRFCNLRDQYLRSKGVIVERISAERVRKMSDLEMDGWLRQILMSL